MIRPYLVAALLAAVPVAAPAQTAPRRTVLAIGALWSLRLAWLQLADLPGRTRRGAALLAFGCALAVIVGAWSLLLFYWT